MTITRSPQATAEGDIEVLLREAKRRSRLRRSAIVAGVLAAIAALALVLAGVSGAGPSRTTPLANPVSAVPIAPGTLKAVGFPPSKADVSFSNVSCASGTACIVVGEVATATTSKSAAWLYEHGSWRPLAAPMLPHGGAGALSCPTTSFCAMVGFQNPSGRHASVQLYDHGGWHEAVTPTPAGAKESNLQAVDCLSPQWCMAVGRAWMHANADVVAYSDLYANGHWALLGVPRPPGDAHQGDADVDGVSCSSSTFCLAVGDAFDGLYGEASRADRYDGRGWSVVHVDRIPQGLLGPLPRPIRGTRMSEQLTGVSCASPTDCAASGLFSAGEGPFFGGMFVLHYDGSGFSRVLVTQGLDAAQQSNYLLGIACSSASRCTSFDQAGQPWSVQRPAPIEALQSDGRGWFLSAKQYPRRLFPLPADVSCLPDGRCLIVGLLEGNTHSLNGRSFPLALVATPRGGL